MVDFTLRSAGAQRLVLSPLYRHIAPLERGIESIGFNRKPTGLQNLAAWFILSVIICLSVIIYRTPTLEEGVMCLFFADGRGGPVSGEEFCVVGQREQVILDPGE